MEIDLRVIQAQTDRGREIRLCPGLMTGFAKRDAPVMVGVRVVLSPPDRFAKIGGCPFVILQVDPRPGAIVVHLRAVLTALDGRRAVRLGPRSDRRGSPAPRPGNDTHPRHSARARSQR